MRRGCSKEKKTPYSIVPRQDPVVFRGQVLNCHRATLSWDFMKITKTERSQWYMSGRDRERAAFTDGSVKYVDVFSWKS